MEGPRAHPAQAMILFKNHPQRSVGGKVGTRLPAQDSYGWIRPDVAIDHKLAARREGKVFAPRQRHNFSW